ncbi:MAG TPA: phospholipase D-like domain-containing protein [Vicinamibacterales bacterium]
MTHRHATLAGVAACAVVFLCGISTRAHAAETLCDPSFQNCRTQLLSLIDSENVEIDAGFWFMEDQRYVNHILARWQAGVPVRLIVDPRANPTYTLNATSLSAFQQAGIPMVKKSGGGIMHYKMMLFAGQNMVEFGSANYSDNAFVPVSPYQNYVSETVFYEDDPAIVNTFKTKFDNLWVDTTNYSVYANVASRVRSYPIYTLSADMNFPPSQSYANRVIGREKAETVKIDVDMYRITQQSHSDSLIAAFQRGVPVRYMGETKEYRDASRLWVAWNMDRMYAAGIPMRVRAADGENHEKLVLLYGQGMTVFGSSNFTSPSDTSQEEHNYFTTKSWIFQWFEDQYNRKWNNSAGFTETGPFVPLPPDTPVYQSPANGATAVATSGVALKWYGGPWAHIYDIYFGTDPTAGTLLAANQPLGPSQTTTQFQSYPLPPLQPGTTYYWKIVSKTAALVPKPGPIWSFTTSGTSTSTLPSPWVETDIGAVPFPGSTSYSGGTFSITGSGADIWGAADAFHYVYQPLSGDGSIEARIGSIQNTNAWAKAGVMIRESLDPGSKHAHMLASAAKGDALQWRPTTGGTSLTAPGSLSAPPRWVRLVRSGDTFTGYESADGSTWTQVSQQTITMAADVLVGIAVTSHSTSASTTAVVTNVTVGGTGGGGGTGSTLPAPWTDGDVGSVTIPGSASYATGMFTVTASGNDIWNTADAFHFVYQPLNGDGSIEARVDSLQNTYAWAKAGVMIRESLNASSAHAIMLMSAAKGAAFQWRATTGGTSKSVSGSLSAPPRWVRLVRSGDTFTGYESPDGSTWIQVSSQTISMAANVFVGLAVTSHNTSATTTAQIDSVTVQ